jgi:hypothetical protein
MKVHEIYDKLNEIEKNKNQLFSEMCYLVNDEKELELEDIEEKAKDTSWYSLIILLKEYKRLGLLKEKILDCELEEKELKEYINKGEE